MTDWRFSDLRLDQRAERIYESIVATGSLVLRCIGGDRAGEIAAHRFLDNERVTPEAIIETLSHRTGEAVRGRRILAVQDTTEINFAGRDKARHGLGPAAGDISVGFFIHPVVAVDIEQGALIGLAGGEIWTRPASSGAESRKQRARRLDFDDKESARWLRSMHCAAERLCEAEEIIVVGDRESDIYSVFARRPDTVNIIVRAKYNRPLASGGKMFDDGCASGALGCIHVDIAARPGRKARTAAVRLRAGRVTVKKPREVREACDPDTVTLNFVEAVEVDPPARTSPVCWRLLTTLAVANLAEAEDIVRLYRLRWRIEEVFRALKTGGLDLEASQVEAGHRVMKLAALALAAAVRVVQLVDARDGTDRPASDIADPALLDAFAQIARPLAGATVRQQNPHPPGNLAWLSWIVARLGGWNCYYKPPGPKTMARGWQRLSAMTAGFLCAMETAKCQTDV